ncbi:MAG: hypothetical protein AAGG80_00680 [Pseudomonadota bacterium]
MKIKSKVIASSILILSLTSIAYAADNNLMTLQKPTAIKAEKLRFNHHIKHCQRHFMKLRQIRRHSFAMSWRHAFNQGKQLSASQAKLIAKAASILYTNQKLNIGVIKTIKAPNGHINYAIPLLNQQGNVVRTIEMNGINGHVVKSW